MRRTLRTLRIWLTTLLAMSALYLFALLPLWFTHLCGRGVGALARWLPTELGFTSRRNIAACFPDWTPRQRRRLMRNSLRETGKTLMESAALWLWPGRRVLQLVRRVHGEEWVAAARAEGKGVIFAVPHLGSWELMNLYCSSRYPLTSLYRPPRLEAMDKVIRRGREKLGSRLVPTDNRGVKSLLAALKQGETVLILPDQVPGAGQGEYAPFFGLPAYSMTLLPRLVAKTGARVVFGYARRLPRGAGFELHFHPAEAAVYDPHVAQAVAAMNRGIEACARELPGQYLWSYRRFKSPPQGERNIYVKNR